MPQGIWTRKLNPTTHKGTRIKAIAKTADDSFCRGPEMSVTVPYDYSLSSYENHEAAAFALLNKLEWSGDWCSGARPDDIGYMFVNITASDRILVV